MGSRKARQWTSFTTFLLRDAVEPGRPRCAYLWSTDQLARYRIAVNVERDREDLCCVPAAAAGRGTSMQLGGDILRSRRRGMAADHPRTDLLGTTRCTCGVPGCPTCYTGVPTWIVTGSP